MQYRTQNIAQDSRERKNRVEDSHEFKIQYKSRINSKYSSRLTWIQNTVQDLHELKIQYKTHMNSKSSDSYEFKIQYKTHMNSK